MASDDSAPGAFAALEREGHRVVRLGDLLEEKSTPPAPDGSGPPRALAAALRRVNGNLLGFVDALVAAEGRTFTGTWFSTLTSFVHRVRGYRGFADSDSYFSASDRWAAFQGFEAPRHPLYMREWAEAWRGIDGRDDAAPFAGEAVFADADAAKKTGYPLGGACALPAAMRYWRPPSHNDARLLASGGVPPLRGDRYLTFVPDLGGWNNVRLSLENVLVIARSTGRTLVLPPPQTFYLLTKCKEKCTFGMDDFLPHLRDEPNLVISADKFFRERLPALLRDRRLRRPHGLGAVLCAPRLSLVPSPLSKRAS